MERRKEMSENDLKGTRGKFNKGIYRYFFLPSVWKTLSMATP